MILCLRRSTHVTQRGENFTEFKPNFLLFSSVQRKSMQIYRFSHLPFLPLSFSPSPASGIVVCLQNPIFHVLPRSRSETLSDSPRWSLIGERGIVTRFKQLLRALLCLRKGNFIQKSINKKNLAPLKGKSDIFTLWKNLSPPKNPFSSFRIALHHFQTPFLLLLFESLPSVNNSPAMNSVVCHGGRGSFSCSKIAFFPSLPGEQFSESKFQFQTFRTEMNNFSLCAATLDTDGHRSEIFSCTIRISSLDVWQDF